MKRSRIAFWLVGALIALQACESRPRRITGNAPSSARPEIAKEPAAPASTRVTIDKRDASFGEIVEEFRFRGGLRLVVERPHSIGLQRLTFAVKDEPVRSALESFARKAGLEAAWSGPSEVSLRPVPRMTVDFKDADVRVVLDLILRVSGASIIVSPDVSGTITINVSDAPWSDVLQSVARTLGLRVVREDSGILRISKE